MSNKSYRFGIIKTKSGRTATGNRTYRNIGICACGQHILSLRRWETNFECNKCGNDYFIDATNQTNNGRFVIPYLGLLRKDNRGFKVRRVNLSINYDEDNGIKVIKENLTRTMDYDIVNRVLKVWREDEIEYDYATDINNIRKRDYANRQFFRQLDTKTFLNRVSNEVTRGLYGVAKKLSTHNNWNKKDVLMKGLASLMDYGWLQILANAGVPDVSRFYGNGGYYYNANSNPIDESKTKPHEILRVPKFMISYIREDLSIDRHVLQQLQSSLRSIDSNKFKEIMSIVKDESTIKELSNSIDTVMQIHVDYGYTNLKKLIIYLFRETRILQGISSARDSSTYLRDYIRMSRSMDLEWEKYPKSLKKEHDIVQMNYNLINDKNDKQREFQLAVEKKSYQDLVYEDKKSDYTIIVPSETEDLIREGNQLSHCVASYVKDVADDRCKILFLREKEQIEKPLATIEVRGFNIRQARGFANRALNEEQKEFVSKWAEENNLVEAYY